MKISVVIPMFNEARHIGRTLDGIRRAADFSRLDCELWVVDNGSTDAGPCIAAEHGARVLHYPGLSIGALRNRGVEAGGGDWLAFVDADIETPGNWLSIWKDVHEACRADVLALECDTPADAPWFARVWQHRNLAAGQRGRPRDWLTTQNLCMTRSWFERVGGFDERLPTGEDKEFTLRLHRAGARLLRLPAPAVLHWGYERNWREWLGKEYWRQSGHLQLIRGNARLRLLRFPLFCLGTGLCSLFALAMLLFARPLPAILALFPGLLAAFALSLRQSVPYRQPVFTLQLTVLHWLRLHVGAAALWAGFCKRAAWRPERG
ncbi:MAG: glycosyltransferase [Zoogloeaceae bacterium]|jgi:glycosyltransferase involved in cell wall biosynthesis|nr:glycosyltransferase [Zoogloeaceae bacterium]